jgi:hypothetical protein
MCERRHLVALIVCALVVVLFAVAPYPAQAAKGFSEWEVVRAASTQGTGTDSRRVFANCPAGKKVLGGGAVVEYQRAIASRRTPMESSSRVSRPAVITDGRPVQSTELPGTIGP